MQNDKLRPKEAATYIGKSVSWLNQARCTGSGPVYFKIGGNVFYSPVDLDAFMTSKRRTAVYDFANDNQRARAAA